MNFLITAEQLKNELDTLRPLDNEAEARIMQKFRLDWNYHSNNLEGNSLTYGETKALILFGITAQGKPLKDHFEITGHNEAINWILEIVKDETPLTEKFIRELHSLLLKESSYKEAQAPNGKPTRRKIEVGKYKTLPNHVVTVTGETFYFATPVETPAKMQELIEWFRKEKEKPDVNPIILAALFHYRFIRIHPFDDGNGRVARILMNFILMQFGYPPAIIKTEDKENYFAVLRLADADQFEPFIEYITQNLINSLEIMIRGAKGESVEEFDDFDKELALLEKKLQFNDKSNRLSKNPQIVNELLEELIAPIINEFINSSAKFDKFYISNRVASFILNKVFNPPTKDNVLVNLRNILRNEPDISGFDIRYVHDEFFNPNFVTFNHSSELYFEFREYTYSIEFIGDHLSSKIKFQKPYSELISPDELYSALNKIAKSHKTFIEEKTKNQN
ncbi:MAG: Fic family protein [Acidobacteriota bacterium]|nr:Fic family protein [Acidobacteriota bacterium]